MKSARQQVLKPVDIVPLPSRIHWFKYAHNPFQGFTLAELLVVVLILGVIITFTVPKVLQSQQDKRLEAVRKETYATLAQIIYQGVMKDEITDSNYHTYIRDHFNAVKICDTHVLNEGCITEEMKDQIRAQLGGSAWEDKRGVVLHNGAVVWFLLMYPNTVGFMLDMNGPEGGSVAGTDFFMMRANIGKVTHAPVGLERPIRPGMLGCYLSAVYCTKMYDPIFK